MFPHPSYDQMNKDILDWMNPWQCPLEYDCSMFGQRPQCDPDNHESYEECLFDKFKSGKDIDPKELYRLWLALFIKRQKGC